MMDPQNPYQIEKDNVFFCDSRIISADPATFEALSKEFARDAQAIYVGQTRIIDSDPESFEVLLEHKETFLWYARDKHHVYRSAKNPIVKDLDGSTFKVLNHHYGADCSFVYSFDNKRIIKGATPENFSMLEQGYAVSQSKVYFKGLIVPSADPKSFRILGKSMASDKKTVYWEDYPIPGLDPNTIEILGENYFRAGEQILYLAWIIESIDPDSSVVLSPNYIKDNRNVFFGRDAVKEADPNSFVVLENGYSRDANHVFYREEIVPMADVSTFQVLDGKGVDSARVYEGAISVERPKVEEKKISTADLAAIAKKLINGLIKVLFPVFDLVQSNDEYDKIYKAFEDPETTPNELPDVNLTLNGAMMTLEHKGFSVQASFSGYLTAMGTFWGITRNKILNRIPCTRMIDERGVMMPQGDQIIGEASKEIIEDLFEALNILYWAGFKEEAELVAFQMDKGINKMHPDKGDNYFLKLRQVLEQFKINIYDKSYLSNVSGSTPHSVIKKLNASPYITSSHVLERVVVAEKFHQALNEVVYSSILKFDKLVPPFLHLLNDPHPLVSDLMWQNLDFLASRLFYYQAYRSCLEYLPILINRGINLEINLARRWECLMAERKLEEAGKDWESIQAITTDKDRAPAIYTGLHTDYPNYRFWQVAAFLRLARAYMLWAEGKDPCKDVTIKNPVEPESKRALLLKQAGEALELASKSIKELAKNYNAMVAGKILAELLADLNEFTKEWEYGDYEAIMHMNYVEYAMTKRPYHIDTITIIRTGLYQKDKGNFFDLLSQTDRIKPLLGQSYGIEYHVGGGPLCRVVPTKIQVFRKGSEQKGKEENLASYDAISYIGMDNVFYWIFEKEEELRAVEWTVELSIDPDGPMPVSLCKSFEVTS